MRLPYFLLLTCLAAIDGLVRSASLPAGQCPSQFPTTPNIMQNPSFENYYTPAATLQNPIPSVVFTGWQVPNLLSRFWYPNSLIAQDGSVYLASYNTDASNPSLAYKPTSAATLTTAGHRYLLSFYIANIAELPTETRVFHVANEKGDLGSFTVKGPTQPVTAKTAYTRYCLEISADNAGKGDQFTFYLTNTFALPLLYLDNFSLQDLDADTVQTISTKATTTTTVSVTASTTVATTETPLTTTTPTFTVPVATKEQIISVSQLNSITQTIPVTISTTVTSNETPFVTTTPLITVPITTTAKTIISSEIGQTTVTNPITALTTTETTVSPVMTTTPVVTVAAKTKTKTVKQKTTVTPTTTKTVTVTDTTCTDIIASFKVKCCPTALLHTQSALPEPTANVVQARAIVSTQYVTTATDTVTARTTVSTDTSRTTLRLSTSIITAITSTFTNPLLTFTNLKTISTTSTNTINELNTVTTDILRTTITVPTSTITASTFTFSDPALTQTDVQSSTTTSTVTSFETDTVTTNTVQITTVLPTSTVTDPVVTITDPALTATTTQFVPCTVKAKAPTTTKSVCVQATATQYACQTPQDPITQRVTNKIAYLRPLKEETTPDRPDVIVKCGTKVYYY